LGSLDLLDVAIPELRDAGHAGAPSGETGGTGSAVLRRQARGRGKEKRQKTMSSSESPDKFEARRALTESKAKLVALVGVEKTEEIYQQALSEASRGEEVDDQILLDAMERAYDKAARIESLP
jgi:hypothetical protein